MQTVRAQIPNLLSISRVPASAVFVVVFSTSVPLAYWVALVIAILALLTDFADGYLARKWGAVTEAGYFLDGLGDKCFTIALCLVISREHPELVLPMWALITRELLLYGLRAIDPSKATNLVCYRNISLWQAGTARIAFGIFFLMSGMKLYLVEAPPELEIVFFMCTALAVIFGWASVVLLARTLAS